LEERGYCWVTRPIYSYGRGKKYQGCSPLVVRQGVTKKDGSSWVLLYEDWRSLRRSLEKVELRINEQSACVKGRQLISCEGMRDGQRVSVIGIRSGDALKVLKLSM
jgi:hypothetical protein